MDLPDPLAKPGLPGEFEDTIRGEDSLQPNSQNLAFFVESRRHMGIFWMLYIPAGIAAEQRTKK